MHPKTADYIERLKARIASQKQLIGKRNDKFHVLHERLYDINLMFHLFIKVRELDHEWSKEFSIPEFFILHGTREMNTFKMEDAAIIVSELPEAFIIIRRPGVRHKDPMKELETIVNNSLNNLVRLGYLGMYKYKKEKTYYIKPDGTWFLMQRVKEFRSLILYVLKATARPKRRVGLTKRL